MREGGKKIDIFQDLILHKGWGSGSANFLCFLVTIFVLKTPRNAMKQMISSFKMKGDVISDLDALVPKRLDIVGNRTFRGAVWGS